MNYETMIVTFVEPIRKLDDFFDNSEATFFARVEGNSMKNEGITEGDILVVDKAIEPYDGCLAVAYVDGEFTLNACAWVRPYSARTHEPQVQDYRDCYRAGFCSLGHRKMDCQAGLRNMYGLADGNNFYISLLIAGENAYFRV